MFKKDNNISWRCKQRNAIQEYIRNTPTTILSESNHNNSNENIWAQHLKLNCEFKKLSKTNIDFTNAYHDSIIKIKMMEIL